MKNIDILYEDAHYIVFDKPAGLLVIPTPKREKYTLSSIVNEQYAAKNKGNLYPCHRLDRETSGVILFAKSKHYQELMMNIFRSREIRKAYLGFVHGHLSKKQGELRSRISDFDQQKFQPRAFKKLAITHYRVREQKKDYSVVEIEPLTGRTNQIRIQFSQIGHPLVGERKYAVANRFALRFRRTALHALSLEWRDPLSRKFIRVTSNLAEDMENFLKNQ